MAETATNPGNETSENRELQWVKAGAGILMALLVALLASGLIPSEHAAYTVISTIVTVGGMLGYGSGKYSESRGKVKAMALAARGEVDKAKAANPPQG